MTNREPVAADRPLPRGATIEVDPLRRNQRPASERFEPLLEIQHLTVEYGVGAVAVSGFDLTIGRGEIVGIVGESGSGKSTLAYAVMRLLREPAHIREGRILYYQGDSATELLSVERDQLRALRWSELAIVFQSAMNALNPVMTLYAQIDDVLRAHDRTLTRTSRRERGEELFKLVGIPLDRLRAYPHELSGGMRQRALIAIALALKPNLLIMDEPTTALDVVTQRQILDELLRLRAELGFSMMFVTHDLALIMDIADRIVVMYAGRAVEAGGPEDLLRDPRHPYTIGLLNSFPTVSGPKRRLTGIPGFPPNIAELPEGCAFHPRCDRALDVCRQQVPTFTVEEGSSRGVRCWLHGASTTLGAEASVAGQQCEPAKLARNQGSDMDRGRSSGP